MFIGPHARNPSFTEVLQNIGRQSPVAARIRQTIKIKIKKHLSDIKMNIYLKLVHIPKQTKKAVSSVTHKAITGTACHTCVLLLRQWSEAFDDIS